MLGGTVFIPSNVLASTLSRIHGSLFCSVPPTSPARSLISTVHSLTVLLSRSLQPSCPVSWSAAKAKKSKFAKAKKANGADPEMKEAGEAGAEAKMADAKSSAHDHATKTAKVAKVDEKRRCYW